MALRNLIVCINSAGGSNDLPCVVLHSPSREVSMQGARSILAALRPNGPGRRERHILPAVDPGRHATFFVYERAATSLMIDLSQSEVARCAAVDWVTPIAPTRHIQGSRRCIVLHCADLLSWSHQNALKNIIESSQSNTQFILTTSQASALQGAIISRGVVIRCPGSNVDVEHAGAVDYRLKIDGMRECVQKALTARPPVAACKACKEAAQTLSRLYDGSNSPSFLMDLLSCLLDHNTTHNDAVSWHSVQEMMKVDEDLSQKGPSNRGATLTVSLHRALFALVERTVST